ncbi:superoxide dismutase-like protein [Lumpy skin disease virus]|nr:superoxide dismutase-like protein [Lumpy skin disease virus]
MIRKYYDFNKTVSKAVCVLKGYKLHGVINFDQLQNGIVIISGVVLGLPEGNHGLHVHEFGDETNGFLSMGNHYNPENKKHGSPFNNERHIGDLGNIYSNKYGISYIYILDGKISLVGDYSIIGRSLVISEKNDDLGKGYNFKSFIDGNSGNGVAYGIIGIA